MFWRNTDQTPTAAFQGLIATHEIGHWLNLRHIWGDFADTLQGLFNFVCVCFYKIANHDYDYKNQND